MKIVTTKVVLHGIYAWGKGYENNDMWRKWEEFWDRPEANGIFWHVFKDTKKQTRHLVAIGGSICLHPMDFAVLYHQLGGTITYQNGRKVEVFSEIEELKEIMKRCCAYVGGSYTMEPVKVHEIDA